MHSLCRQITLGCEVKKTFLALQQVKGVVLLTASHFNHLGLSTSSYTKMARHASTIVSEGLLAKRKLLGCNCSGSKVSRSNLPSSDYVTKACPHLIKIEKIEHCDREHSSSTESKHSP